MPTIFLGCTNEEPLVFTSILPQIIRGALRHDSVWSDNHGSRRARDHCYPCIARMAHASRMGEAQAVLDGVAGEEGHLGHLRKAT
jgi:hypothetical protein